MPAQPTENHVPSLSTEPQHCMGLAGWVRKHRGSAYILDHWATETGLITYAVPIMHHKTHYKQTPWHHHKTQHWYAVNTYFAVGSAATSTPK